MPTSKKLKNVDLFNFISFIVLLLLSVNNLGCLPMQNESTDENVIRNIGTIH